MTSEELQALLARGLEELMGIDPSGLSVKSLIQEDLDIDSLGLMELVMWVEEELNVEIEEAEFEGLSTVEDMVRLLSRYLETADA